MKNSKYLSSELSLYNTNTKVKRKLSPENEVLFPKQCIIESIQSNLLPSSRAYIYLGNITAPMTLTPNTSKPTNRVIASRNADIIMVTGGCFRNPRDLGPIFAMHHEVIIIFINGFTHHHPTMK